MEWFETLPGTYDEVWRRLQRGVADAKAPARHPVLATVGAAAAEPSGEARIVVLRGADQDGAALEIHTDGASAKVAELRTCPRATLLVWEDRARLQIRLRVRITVRPGTPDEWVRVPTASRPVYQSTPPPGIPIETPDVPRPDAEHRFTLLIAEIDEIEALHLGRDRHSRAIFRREDDWAGQWLSP